MAVADPKDDEIPDPVDDNGQPFVVAAQDDEIPDPVEDAPAAPTPEPSGLDYLMAMADGASFGMGGKIADTLFPSKAKIAHPDAQVSGSVMGSVPDTAGTRAARLAGGVAESIPATIAAGPSVLGQAALGALTGAGSAWGNDESVAGGAVVGGALGGLGGVLAKGAQALRAPVKPWLNESASYADEALGKLRGATPDLADAIMKPWEYAKNALGRGAVRGGAAINPTAARVAGQVAGQKGAGIAGDEVSALAGASKALAQDAPWDIEIGEAELPQNGVRAVIGEPDLSKTILSDEDEAKFQQDMRTGPGYGQWYRQFVKLYGGEPDLNDPEYDYRAAWQAGIRPEPYKYDKGRYHWASSLPDGSMLKGENHPTAWMEHFMRETGRDPHEVGVKSEAEGDRYISRHVRANIGEPRILDDGWDVEIGQGTVRAVSPEEAETWAVESLLFGGSTSLPPDAERRLNDAVQSQDAQKLATETFLLSSRYPKFSDALRTQRAKLTREED